MKTCTKCGIEKPLNNFCKQNKGKFGVTSQCKECKKLYDDNWYSNPNNKEKKSIYGKLPKTRNKQKEYANSDHNLKVRAKRWLSWHNNKKEIDYLYKLTCNIRSLIFMSMLGMGYKKTSKTFEILGCTFEEFKIHIESQFQEGMSWENRSLWHLDHIYPVSLAESEQHLIQLNHYTNFQPLWAEDNLKKANKTPEEWQQTLDNAF